MWRRSTMTLETLVSVCSRQSPKPCRYVQRGWSAWPPKQANNCTPLTSLCICEVRSAHPALGWNLDSATRKLGASSARRFFVRVPEAASASKGEIDRAEDEEIRDADVPRGALTEEQERDHGEDDERDTFLHDLELRHGERPRTDTVCRYLERVLWQRDEPTHQDHPQQRLRLQLQMAIPCKGHEDIRDDEEENRCHRRFWSFCCLTTHRRRPTRRLSPNGSDTCLLP